MGFKRYAVYFGPRPNEPLHDFGKFWFGIDPETGASLPTSPLAGHSEDLHSAIIKAPRHYALHGTLKPPFVLADGTEYDALKQAVSDLAATLSPVTLSPLYLKDLNGFLALCPTEPSAVLRALAGRCVTELDAFRRPASEGEIEKRRAAGLTPNQDANLLRWGYPYVLDDFRFHITLTSRLQDKEIQTVAAALSPRVSPILTAPTVLQDLCLYGEPEDGSPFRIVARIPLG
jgi:putative phosphonate metabolism protein